MDSMISSRVTTSSATRWKKSRRNSERQRLVRGAGSDPLQPLSRARTGHMQSLRVERVRELLKRQIGEVIRRELPVSEAGVVTVNEIGLSNDLQSATVYVGIVGSADQRKRGV